MAKERRYYWLKLPQIHFDTIIQKKMRKQPNGVMLQIIYLKLMLQALNTEGVIYYQGVYNTLEQEIAEAINEDLNDVEKALKYFIDERLAAFKEQSVFIPETIALTGSEGLSAERMRNKRVKDKSLMSQCDDKMSQSDDKMSQCYVEKEKEKEIDKEIDKTICSELKNFSSEPSTDQGTKINISVINLTLNTGEEFSISEEDFREWCALYPAVDVMQELRKMRGWLDANPARRKTKRGIKRFIVSWLARCQDAAPKRTTVLKEPNEDLKKIESLYISEVAKNKKSN